jgi:hypothetical protein
MVFTLRDNEAKASLKTRWGVGVGWVALGNIHSVSAKSGNKRGKYHCTIDLLFDWFGISCMTTDNFCFYLQNSLIQTGQTLGQWYSDTSPFSIPWPN